MNFLKKILSFFASSKLTENQMEFDNSKEDCCNTYYPLTEKLNIDKEEAIRMCDGCEEEVFVLRLAGEDIGYYKSINQLCIKNNFKNKTTVYRYWNNRNEEEHKLLFGKYEIIMLS